MQGRRNYLKNKSVCTKLIYANVSSVFIECSCSKEYGTSCGLIQASSSLTGDLCLITAVSSMTIDFSFCEFHFNLDSKVSKRVIFFFFIRLHLRGFSDRQMTFPASYPVGAAGIGF